MYELREFLSRKVAGIPVGAIIAVASAGMLYLAVKMNPTNDESAASEDESDTDYAAGDADYNSVDNPVFEASPHTPTVVAVASEDTNELWGRRVRDYLVTVGVRVSDAERAVDKYLNSTPLTTQERAWIDTGIRQYGYPPQDITWTDIEDPAPVTVGGDTPGSAGSGVTPPTKQGEPPLRHTVKNARDNGPGELARLYYGSNAPNKKNLIEGANIDIGPGPWKVGTKVKIPKDHKAEYFTATAAANGAGEIARKNGTTPARVKALNPSLDFPVKAGTKVRVK